MYDLGSPVSAGPLQVVQLAKDLKLALELQPNQEGRDSLRAQLPTETAQALIHWLQSGTVSTIYSMLQISFHLNICSPEVLFAFCSVVLKKSNCSHVSWRSHTIFICTKRLHNVSMCLFNEQSKRLFQHCGLSVLFFDHFFFCVYL